MGDDDKELNEDELDPIDGGKIDGLDEEEEDDDMEEEELGM